MKLLPYILGVLALFPVTMQIIMLRRSRRMEGTVLPPAPEPLATHLNTHPTSLLYFYSSRCLACQDMAPVIDEIAARNRNVIKLNVKDMPDFARSIGLVATPASVLVRDGKAVKILAGFSSRKALEKLLAQ